MSEDIYKFLQANARGRDNAIKFDQIASAFKITWREVAAVIESLRLEGKVISTSRREPYGAYLPANKDEARESLRAGYAALWHQKATLDALTSSIETQFGEQVVKEIQEEFLEVK